MDPRLIKLRELVEQSADRFRKRDMRGMDVSGLYALRDEILTRIGKQLESLGNQGLFSVEVRETLGQLRAHGFAESVLPRAICHEFAERLVPYDNRREVVKQHYGISDAARTALCEEWLCTIRDEEADRIDAIAVALGIVRRDAESIVGMLSSEDGARSKTYVYSDLSMKARDKWIYQQMQKGLGNTQIINQLSEIFSLRNWEPLTTEQSLTNAAKRYISATDSEKLRRKVGRKKHPNTQT